MVKPAPVPPDPLRVGCLVAAAMVVLACVLLLSCCTVQMHEPEELEAEAYRATRAAWDAFGMPAPRSSCHLDKLVVVEHVDPVDFRNDCWRKPDLAHACLDWDWDGREVRNEQYPVAIISPLARNGSVPSLAVHELLHAMLQCSQGDDPEHKRDEIWHTIESEAKAKLY